MILLYLFLAVVLINCAYYLLFAKFSFLKSSESHKAVNFPVSVIVCAKNESANLKKHLPLLMAQEYPSYELILINDASTDDTLEVMQSFASRGQNIEIVNVRNNEAFWANKKYALTLGIKRAKHNHLLFIDADCYPASSKWLAIMVSHFSDQKSLVLGYGAYQKAPGLLNKIIRFETMITATQYFSYAQAGNPYMGVGRNLAYTSALYYENKGFMSHIKISSGDDDLFVNEAATAKNTAICTHPEAFTYSIPKKKTPSWHTQKKRHYSTARFYKIKHRVSLAIYYIFNLFFWILVPIILLTEMWVYGLVVLLIRLIMQYIVIGKAAKKLKESDLIALIPFYEIFLVFSQLSIFISNSGQKNSRWK